jgi:hypothetical protein
MTLEEVPLGERVILDGKYLTVERKTDSSVVLIRKGIKYDWTYDYIEKNFVVEFPQYLKIPA